MSKVFFPSCKVTAHFPEASRKLKAYIEQHEGAVTTGCCKLNLQKLSKDDTALVVCNSCGAYIDESAASEKLEFVWTIIDNDPDFALPDHHGEQMTLQDCWRAFDRSDLQDTVRSLLRKMNIEIVELEENREKTRFCGAGVLRACSDLEKQLAPHRYGIGGAGIYQPMETEEQDRWLREWCSQIKTEKVVTYCPGCYDGIKRGGKDAVHLLELVFPS